MAQNHVRKQTMQEIESQYDRKNKEWEINSDTKVTFDIFRFNQTPGYIRENIIWKLFVKEFGISLIETRLILHMVDFGFC